MANTEGNGPESRSFGARLRAAPGVKQLLEMGNFLSAVAYAARKIFPIVHSKRPGALWALVVLALVHTALSTIQYRMLPFVADALRPGMSGGLDRASYWHLVEVGVFFGSIVATVFVLNRVLDILTNVQDRVIRSRFATFAPRTYAKMGVMAFFGTKQEKDIHQMLETADYNLLFVIPGLLPTLRFGILGSVNLALVVWHAPLAGAYLAVGILLSSLFELHGAVQKALDDRFNWGFKRRATAWKKHYSSPIALKSTLVSNRVESGSARIQDLTERVIANEAKADAKQLKVEVVSWFVLAATIFGVGATVINAYARRELEFGVVLMLFILVPLTISSWRTAVQALARQALGSSGVRDLLAFVEELERNPRLIREVSMGTKPFPDGPVTIEITDLHFRYQKDKPLVLPLLDLEIRPGEQFFLCAGSGVGKTTLTDLQLQIVPAPSGMIFLSNGETRLDLNEINPDRYRACVLCITQDSARPVETLRIWFATAIGLSDPSKISEDLIWQALEDACIAHEVRKWAKGLDEKLSFDDETRTAMSGGMLRRINIAEIALKLRYMPNIRVLIADEPYEGIDGGLIDTIHANLSRLAREKGVSLIIPWHRAKDFPNDANIVFLDVVESPDVADGITRVYRGTRDELVRDVPAFRRYANIPLPEEVHATQ